MTILDQKQVDYYGLEKWEHDLNSKWLTYQSLKAFIAFNDDRDHSGCSSEGRVSYTSTKEYWSTHFLLAKNTRNSNEHDIFYSVH